MGKSSTSTARNAIVFVHGLGGSPVTTWAKMVKCFANDPDFKDVEFDYFRYPTRIFRLPLTPPLPGLRDLADGLRTFLEESHGTRGTIAIVAHSLGGLIVRQMLVSAARLDQTLNVTKLALMAVPSTGSTLANVGSQISFSHRQLKGLCKDEESLRTLNIDWDQLRIESKLHVKYILGGSDRVVPSESAVPYIGRENKAVLINAGHGTIVCPDDVHDIRYKTLKRFLFSKLTEPHLEEAPKPLLQRFFDRPADPLFDVYTPVNEIFYIKKSFDGLIGDIFLSGHIWLTGESGVGKSAVARRTVYACGWRLFHINLSGHEIIHEADLFDALCLELQSLLSESVTPEFRKSFTTQVSWARWMLLSLRSDMATAYVIEELPILPKYIPGFLSLLTTFLDLIDADARLFGQTRFIFSSRYLVSPRNPATQEKIYDKLQFLNLQSWTEIDIARLVALLSSSLKPELTAAEQASITVAANGSPRFCKTIFRQWRNQTSEDLSV